MKTAARTRPANQTLKGGVKLDAIERTCAQAIGMAMCEWSLSPRIRMADDWLDIVDASFERRMRPLLRNARFLLLTRDYARVAARRIRDTKEAA